MGPPEPAGQWRHSDQRSVGVGRGWGEGGGGGAQPGMGGARRRDDPVLVRGSGTTEANEGWVHVEGKFWQKGDHQHQEQ